MLAVETEAVISRIWLMTSEKRSTTELTWVARSPSSSLRLTCGVIVEMPLLKLTGDLDDLEQGPNEPAAEKPAENDRQDDGHRQDAEGPELVLVDRGEGDFARDGRPG